MTESTLYGIKKKRGVTYKFWDTNFGTMIF